MSLLNMFFNIFSALLFFLFIFYFLYRFYNSFIYPLIQFFKRKNEHGYIINDENNYEHRTIVENKINRHLNPSEEVHHINGKKWDNRLSNLALMTRENHQAWHARLSWMYANKMFPSIRTQRNKLIEDFEAILF
jgi:hypothetical protein